MQKKVEVTSSKDSQNRADPVAEKFCRYVTQKLKNFDQFKALIIMILFPKKASPQLTSPLVSHSYNLRD